MSSMKGFGKKDDTEKISAAQGGDDSDSGSDTSEIPKDAPDNWKKALKSCRGYRSHLSRRANSARQLIAFGEANPSSAAATSLLEAKAALDKAYDKVCQAFQTLFDQNPPDVAYDEQQMKLDKAAELYDETSAAILQAITVIKRPQLGRVTRADWGADPITEEDAVTVA